VLTKFHILDSAGDIVGSALIPNASVSEGGRLLDDDLKDERG
jgi:hypothetical protein